jgi:hypothetical protein
VSSQQLKLPSNSWKHFRTWSNEGGYSNSSGGGGGGNADGGNDLCPFIPSFLLLPLLYPPPPIAAVILAASKRDRKRFKQLFCLSVGKFLTVSLIRGNT